MRVELLGSFLAIAAAVAPAQNLPLAASGTNKGNIDGGFYFTLSCNTTVTWTNLNYVASDSSVAGNSSLHLYVGPSTWVGNVASNPGPWSLVAATVPVAIPGGVDTPVTGVWVPAGTNTGPAVTFAPGSYGIALEAIGHSWRYANGAATFSDPNLSVEMGGASNLFLAAPTFTPRQLVGSIDYLVGPPALVPYGPGCYASHQSFYEFVPASTAFDLANTSMYLTFDATNNRYGSITAGTTPVVPPTSPSLGHGNDDNRTIHLGPASGAQAIVFPGIGGPGSAPSTVEMCSNMYVNLLGTAPTVGKPTASAWLGGPAARIGCHHDVNPTTGGSTHYEYDTASASHLFTWLGVPTSTFAGSSHTFQLAFFANGDVEFRWGAVTAFGAYGWPMLVGFTPGNGALDPGNIDLSARLMVAPPLATSGFDRAAYALGASAQPTIGGTFDLTATSPSGGSLGVIYAGLADLGPLSPAGIDLAPIGAPGCVMNIALNPALSRIIGNLAGITMSFPVAIPNLPGLVGTHLFCQSFWIDPFAQNHAFSTTGLLTSNALRLTIG
ncbi:MAG TPA: hypothetical protein VFZ65_15440 [Planctomycetota bacterium]|nr:hypothetical protein [Planctomycetota bacterium]